MSEFLNMVLLAVIQGLTEFLPVSSSGHLVLTQHFLGAQEGDIFFDIILHVGTLGSVMVVYRKEILRIYILGFYFDITLSKKQSPDGWYF